MLLHAKTSFFDAEFRDYLIIGWDHIIDIQAYDHLLFIVVLCAVFSYFEWRKVLVIITAFTIGHSLTLALSSLNIIVLAPALVEVLIPLTILATALLNIFYKKNESLQLKTFDRRVMMSYGIALIFGLIHGLGFATNFRFMLGEENSIVKQLFAFNSGLELGQITVVIIFMLVLWISTRFFKMVQREWTLVLSGAGVGIALILILDALSL